MTILQPHAMRKHAVPITRAVAGTPLLKTTVKPGRMAEWRKVRVPLDADFPMGARKDFLFKCAQQFIREEDRIDGAKWISGRGNMRVSGPFPHFDPHEPDTQVGDQGGTRKVARDVRKDTSDNGMVDYVLEGLFNAPEYINEIPTDLAMDLFTRPGGRPGLSPLRGAEWDKVIAEQRSK